MRCEKAAQKPLWVVPDKRCANFKGISRAEPEEETK